jgi:hypothetical protein
MGSIVARHPRIHPFWLGAFDPFGIFRAMVIESAGSSLVHVAPRLDGVSDGWFIRPRLHL